jgi:DNA-binding PadR family transcriptional regulator
MSSGRSGSERAGAPTIADLVVLSLLREQPMHGYALIREYERQQVGDWASVSRAHIYYALKKLAQRKLIVPVEGDSSSEGPERTVYRVDDAGRAALAKALADEAWATRLRPSPFITWLGLSIHADPDDARRVLAGRKLFLGNELRKERATLAELRRGRGERDRVARVMVALAIAQLEAELRALEELG